MVVHSGTGIGVGHKHTVMAEGGNESFRYAFDLFYSNKVGVMKGSKRDNYGGGIRLQYNLKNLKFSNYASFDHLKSVNSLTEVLVLTSIIIPIIILMMKTGM